MNEISERNKVTILQAIFNRHDKNNKKSLTISEFSNLLEELKIRTDIKELFYLLDLNNTGFIYFEDFYKWWKNNFETLDKTIDYNKKNTLLKNAYQTYKLYSSGEKMSKVEFIKLLNDLNIDFTFSQIDNQIDLDNDGFINFDEFLKWLRWI